MSLGGHSSCTSQTGNIREERAYRERALEGFVLGDLVLGRGGCCEAWARPEAGPTLPEGPLPGSQGCGSPGHHSPSSAVWVKGSLRPSAGLPPMWTSPL